ncbi:MULTISPECIES: hypothetical protein, partial [unclassified Curtobacterium]|uniref:hypothetical protein n=1 Tax=unclassified Curtobacterium TaxID=257496 RepID=UPI00226B1F56
DGLPDASAQEDAGQMTDEDETSGTPGRFRTLRPNPLRDVLPWVAVVVGVVLVVRGFFGLTDHHGPEQLFVGAGLSVIGLVVFFINRWQARRGL